MWTLITIAAAALLWLLLATLGAEAEPLLGLRISALQHAALGLSCLAGVLILQALLTQVLRGAKRPGSNSATSDLLRAVLSITLYLVATMLYLRFGLGQDISNVLATSAMLSVIVGLALQPTLGHLFAGVSIEIERPLRVGDFVRRDEWEGQVVSLNWRSVYLRTERGSTLVMPNSEFTSRMMEVIPSDQPYRVQVLFNLASDQPPGQVIRLAMQVLRSGLPGVCQQPAPSVLVIGNDPITGTLRYAARFYTLQFLDRNSLGSAFLERLWYALSREGMSLLTPPAAWWPSSAEAAGEPRLSDASTASATPRPSALPMRKPKAGSRETHELGAAAAQALNGLPSGLRQALLQSARIQRYGRYEQLACKPQSGGRGFGVALLLQGRLQENRVLDDTLSKQALKTLLDELETTQPLGRNWRLGQGAHQRMLQAGSLALGPMAASLCQRIAQLTDEPWLAFQAFASTIPDAQARALFLQQGPAQPLRVVHAGEWLGWAQLLGLEKSESSSGQTLQDCQLLVWSNEGLLHTLRQFQQALGAHAQAQDWAPLVELLREQAPGCEALDQTQLLRCLSAEPEQAEA